MSLALTVFQGRAGDHNDRGFGGAAAIGAMSDRYDEIYAARQTPVTALTRCAVALATLPVVARFHPDALVVWFDAHGDINTSESSATGYLGGLALSGPMGW